MREVEIPKEGQVVHLKGFGFVKVFRSGSTDGDAKYWASNNLQMGEEERSELARRAWGVETQGHAGNVRLLTNFSGQLAGQRLESLQSGHNRLRGHIAHGLSVVSPSLLSLGNSLFNSALNLADH